MSRPAPQANDGAKRKRYEKDINRRGCALQIIEQKRVAQYGEN